MADITSYFRNEGDNSDGGIGSDQDDIFSQIAKSTSTTFDGSGEGTAGHAVASSTVFPASGNPAERLWFPSSETAAIIERVRKLPQSKEDPDIAAGRTVPVVYAEKQTDPLRDQLMGRNRSEALALRTFPNSTQVSKDMEGLKTLIVSHRQRDCRCFRSALNLTSELLAGSMPPSNGSAHNSWLTGQEHLVWSCRFALLVRLGMASVADIEMQGFGPSLDNPDLYQEFFPESFASSNIAQLVPDSYNSLVPFATRLLHAQLPQFLQRYMEALNRLTHLSKTVKRILSALEGKNVGSEFTSIWQHRLDNVQLAIANVLISVKNFREAHEILQSIFKSSKNTDDTHLCKIAALGGRAFMQSGCLPLAEEYFKKAEESSEKYRSFLRSLHAGYLSLASGQFHEAADQFEDAFTKASEEQLRVQVVTCIAVSIMYSGRLQTAIDRLEQVLFSEPRLFAAEPLLINLATMYELHQSNLADKRKLRLLDVAGQFCGDGFDVGCLKLGPIPTSGEQPAHTSLPPPPPVVAPPGPLQHGQNPATVFKPR